MRAAVTAALQRACGGGTLTCRFTHVYTDGPVPYYFVPGHGQAGGGVEMWAELKQAASDAVIAGGGTITHHHAVGRDHMPLVPAATAAVVRGGPARRQGGGGP